MVTIYPTQRVFSRARYSEPDGVIYRVGPLECWHDDDARWWEWEIVVIQPQWYREWRIRNWLNRA